MVDTHTQYGVRYGRAYLRIGGLIGGAAARSMGCAARGLRDGGRIGARVARGGARHDRREAGQPAGWRISQVLAGVTVGGLWAGGPQDAWLAGDECADPATCGNGDAGNGTVVVRHWDGRAWRVVTPPRAYIDSPLDQGVAAVAATSGTNAWVLAAAAPARSPPPTRCI